MRYQSRRSYVDAVKTQTNMPASGWVGDAVEKGHVQFGLDEFIVHNKYGSAMHPMGWFLVRHGDGFLTAMRPDVFERDYETEIL